MDVINELIARDRVLGTLAEEAKECSEDNKNMAALACLFILVEQAIKYALDKIKGDFHPLLKIAKQKKLLSDEEFIVINKMRKIRNKLFHESHYMWFSEEEGILYPFSEEETKKKIFDNFSGACFKIVLKLLSGNIV